MALRKAKKTSGSARRGSRKKTKSYSWAALFWLVFIIFIFGLFIFNREAISKSIQIIQNEFASGETPKPLPEPVASPQEPPAPPPVAGSPAQTPPPVASTLPAQTQEPQQPQTQPQPQEAVRSPELRDRSLYFIQIDRGGSTLRVKVDRKLPASDTPMADVLQALLAGPNADERQRGLISLIPPGTRILSAAVRGETAYVSFSEDFQYNTYGVEGYAGQIRQIVFTVTEFPNVRSVQILIEGRRIDYLGEGIWIGSPLSREML